MANIRFGHKEKDCPRNKVIILPDRSVTADQFQEFLSDFFADTELPELQEILSIFAKLGYQYLINKLMCGGGLAERMMKIWREVSFPLFAKMSDLEKQSDNTPIARFTKKIPEITAVMTGGYADIHAQAAMEMIYFGEEVAAASQNVYGISQIRILAWLGINTECSRSKDKHLQCIEPVARIRTDKLSTIIAETLSGTKDQSLIACIKNYQQIMSLTGHKIYCVSHFCDMLMAAILDTQVEKLRRMSLAELQQDIPSIAILDQLIEATRQLIRLIPDVDESYRATTLEYFNQLIFTKWEYWDESMSYVERLSVFDLAHETECEILPKQDLVDSAAFQTGLYKITDLTEAEQQRVLYLLSPITGQTVCDFHIAYALDQVLKILVRENAPGETKEEEQRRKWLFNDLFEILASLLTRSPENLQKVMESLDKVRVLNMIRHGHYIGTIWLSQGEEREDGERKPFSPFQPPTDPSQN
jgi:hypothetical protein